jgi:DNA-binding NtrC family response regulator
VARKVLVIIDPSARQLDYQAALLRGGYQPHLCEDLGSLPDGLGAEIWDLVLVISGGMEFEAAVLERLRTAGLGAPKVVLSNNPTLEAAVAAGKAGAADYHPAPATGEQLQSLLTRFGRWAEQLAPAFAVGPAFEGVGFAGAGFEGMLGQCPAMREVFHLIRRIAPTESTVLVSGESGTGKEMVVRAIHRLSRRSEQPLLACDCTTLAPTLLESELFGHVKGSFSGAIATKKGLFEVAHQGTLFLDEVANLSLQTQGKLLRVLETRRVRKVGDTVEQEVDIRLIAATNRSLVEMVKRGEFRADLYYRLNVVPIFLPPLRERGADIRLLAEMFLAQVTRKMEIQPGGFSEEALRQLEIYPWPGNVRELRNIVERLAVLYGGVRIERRHLPWEIRHARPEVSSESTPRTWQELKRLKRQLVRDLERRFLNEALARSDQNVAQAAREVHMQRTNFHALLRRHGIRPGGEDSHSNKNV